MIYQAPVSPYNLYQSPKDEVMQIKTAFAAPGAGTSTDIIAAVSGKKIRIISAIISAGDFTTNATLAIQSNATTICVMKIKADASGKDLQRNDAGWIESATGEKINIAAGGNAVNCMFRYVEVTP